MTSLGGHGSYVHEQQTGAAISGNGTAEAHSTVTVAPATTAIRQAEWR